MNVLNLEHISKIYGDKVIFDDISCGIHQGDKIGIIGINGTGKTTFLRILAGLEEADDGQVIMQNGLRISFLSQHPTFPEGATILSYVTQGQREQSWNPETEAHMVLNKLGIEDHEEEIAHLSGGQKKRVALAAVLVNPTDVLILDEPTNDLDIVTLNVLEEYLQNFKGCVIVVSHDRYFMDKVVDHLLVFRGNADIKDFPGNYTQYREWKEVQDQLEKETEAARQARMAPTVEKTSRLEKVQKKKLTFKERKEFEALEVEIPLLEAEKAELETAMSSGTLSNDELLAKSERIAKVIEEIDEKTMRWLELSELA